MRSARRGAAAADADGFELSVVDSIEGVSAGAWDVLAGDEVLASHGWLRTLEACVPGIGLRYVLLRRRGALVAAAPYQLGRTEPPAFSPDAHLFRGYAGWARRLGLTFQPFALCALPLGSGNPLRVDPQLPAAEREPAGAALLGAVEALAFREGRGLWLPRVKASDAELVPRLRRHGYHATRMHGLAYIDLPWNCFEDYLAAVRSFSRSAAQVIRTERRHFQRACRIEPIAEPARHAERLHQLADAHHRRLNGFGVPYTPDFFPSLARNLGSDALIYGAFERGDLIGFSLLLRRGGNAHLPITGIDPERARPHFAYFNLCYYRPIEDAIAWGLRRLYAGTLQFTVKARRGFLIEPLRVFYRSASPLRQRALAPVFALHLAGREWDTRRHGRESLERLRHFDR